MAVVSYGTRALLEACLTSLRPDADAGRAEVWVVDNGSTDGSQAMVRERHPWVRLLEPGRNVGYGPAVDLVADRTSTPFVAAANSDLRVQPGALAALLRAARAHADAGALAPRLLLPGGGTQHTVHPFPTLGLGLLLSSGLALRSPWAARLPMEGAWDPAAGREVDWAHGALLVVRRAAWDAVGGFDREQVFYAEDLDLCWRLRQAGWRTRYVPEAVVHHEVAASAGARWDAGERAVRAQRSTYAWMAERQGLPRTRAVALAHLAGPLLRRQRRYVAMHRTGLEPAAALRAHHRGGPTMSPHHGG